VAPSGLYARLCHAFLVYLIFIYSVMVRVRIKVRVRVSCRVRVRFNNCTCCANLVLRVIWQCNIFGMTPEIAFSARRIRPLLLRPTVRM